MGAGLSRVNAFAVHAGSLYAGNTSSSFVYRWNGTGWQAVGGGLDGPAYALHSDASGHLFAAGEFTAAGGMPSLNIAGWDGSGWIAMPNGPTGPIAPYAYTMVGLKGEVIVGGRFTNAGGRTSSHLARYTDNPTPWIALQPSPSTSALPGDTLSLSATPASGYDFDGPLSFQWRRNGIPITDGPGGASPGGGTVTGSSGLIATLAGLPQPATLTIANLQPGDAGSYDCLTANNCGTATSQAAVVTVAAPCPADLNADGVIDFADYLEFLNLYDALDPRADLNADGVVDFADYLEFLNHYDAGC